MTSLSLAECCRLLAIDPKTLRQWVVQAQMGLHTDPTNAKIKCLDVEQVQSLARLHGRVLKPEASASALSLRTSEAQSQGLSTALPDADLQARLAQMEAQVATLQTQLTEPFAPTAEASGSSAPSSVCSLWKPGIPQGENRRLLRQPDLRYQCQTGQPCLRWRAIPPGNERL